MMKKIGKSTFLIIVLFLFMSGGKVYSAATGSTSGILLKLPVSADNGSLANINSVYITPYTIMSNPAAIQAKNVLFLNYSNWILDSKLGTVGFVYVKDAWNFGFGLNYFDYGVFTKTTEDKNGLFAADLGKISAYSQLLSFSAGKKMATNTDLGIGIKFLSINLNAAASNLLPMISVGMIKHINERIDAGINMQNVRLGSGLKFYKDTIQNPVMLSIGASYKGINLFDIKNMFLSTFSEMQLSNDRSPILKLGAKWVYKYYFVNLGLSNSYDYMYPVTVGAGAQIGDIGFSFSYIPSRFDYIWFSSITFRMP